MGDQRILFLATVSSTQDAAIEHDLQVGDACVSFHQTAGRGRRGKEWNSDGGVAEHIQLGQRLRGQDFAGGIKTAKQAR